MGTDNPHTKAEGVAFILRIQNDVAKENAPGKEQRERKSILFLLSGEHDQERILADVFHRLAVGG